MKWYQLQFLVDNGLDWVEPFTQQQFEDILEANGMREKSFTRRKNRK